MKSQEKDVAEVNEKIGYDCEELSSITHRPYQEEVVNKTLEYWKTHDYGVVEIPTGGGKSLVQAMLIKRLLKDTGRSGVILCLTHVGVLIEQNTTELRRVCPDAPVSVSCASLKTKDLSGRIIFSTIQTIYNQLDQLDGMQIEYVFIDEAHLVPGDDSRQSQYRTVLDRLEKNNTWLKCVGLTATPMRLKSGLIYENDNFFNHLIMAVSMRHLIEKGYLCKITNKIDKVQIDTSNLKLLAGDFIKEELAKCAEEAMPAILDQLVEAIADRKKVLVFACTIQHAQDTADMLSERGFECGYLHSGLTEKEKEQVSSDFRSGKLRGLVNVAMMTTGVNIPDIDVIVMLRPTMSQGLYIQMVGRGMRVADGKENCLILDFAGNIKRFGPVDKEYHNQVKTERVSGGYAPLTIDKTTNWDYIKKTRGVSPLLTSCLSLEEVSLYSYDLNVEEGDVYEVLSYSIEHPRIKRVSGRSKKVEDELCIVYKVRQHENDSRKTIRQLLQPEKKNTFAERTLTPFLQDVFNSENHKGALDIATKLRTKKPAIKLLRAKKEGKEFSSVFDITIIDENKIEKEERKMDIYTPEL